MFLYCSWTRSRCFVINRGGNDGEEVTAVRSRIKTVVILRVLVSLQLMGPVIN